MDGETCLADGIVRRFLVREILEIKLEYKRISEGVWIVERERRMSAEASVKRARNSSQQHA